MKGALARPEQPQKLGQYRGFNVHVEAQGQGCQFVLEGSGGFYTPLSLSYQAGAEFSIQGFVQRLDNYLGSFEKNGDVASDKTRMAGELVTARQSLGGEFPQLAQLEGLRQDNREVIRELQISQSDPAYHSTWKPSGGQAKDNSDETPANETPANETPAPEPPAIGRVERFTMIHIGEGRAFPVFDARSM